MNFVFFALAVLLVCTVYLRWGVYPRFYRFLGVKPLGVGPVDQSLCQLLAQAAKKQRQSMPDISLLPDFSPNALVLRFPFRPPHILLSEGAVRVLEQDELKALLALCIVQCRSRKRILASIFALLAYPLADGLERWGGLTRLLLGSTLLLPAKLFLRSATVMRQDKEAANHSSQWALAAALQKMAVAGRKLPIQRWNFALDGLFSLSPLLLESSPWFLRLQPSVDQRRKVLLADSCESFHALS